MSASGTQGGRNKRIADDMSARHIRQPVRYGTTKFAQFWEKLERPHDTSEMLARVQSRQSQCRRQSQWKTMCWCVCRGDGPPRLKCTLTDWMTARHSWMRLEAPASKWATHDYRELAAADHSSSHINHMSRRFVHHCLYHRRKIGGKYWGTSAEFYKILLGGQKYGAWGTEVPSGI